jgi:hypothetical protein
VDWARRTACQQDGAEGRYAVALAAYVRWLAPRLEELRRQMPGQLAALREQATASGQHRRTPAIVADLALGLELFTQFATEVKALTQKQADALRQRCWQALGEAAAAQAVLQSHGEPAQRFLDLLGAAIRAGKVHLAGPDGQSPANPAGLGWREEGGAWAVSGDRVGWLDGADLYLEPEAAYAAAERMAEAAHEPLGIGVKARHKRLHERGHLVSTDRTRGRLTVRKTLEGHVRAVLRIRAGVVGVTSAVAPTPSPEGVAKGDGRALGWGTSHLAYWAHFREGARSGHAPGNPRPSCPARGWDTWLVRKPAQWAKGPAPPAAVAGGSSF